MPIGMFVACVVVSMNIGHMVGPKLGKKIVDKVESEKNES